MNTMARALRGLGALAVLTALLFCGAAGRHVAAQAPSPDAPAGDGQTGTAGPVDETAPTIAQVYVDPNPTYAALTVMLTATALTGAGNGAESTLAAGEWFEGIDPGAGKGVALTPADGAFDGAVETLSARIAVAGWTVGPHALHVRAQNGAGEWGPLATIVLNVTLADFIFSDSFESGDFTSWGTAAGASAFAGRRLSVTAAADMGIVGTYGMQARVTRAPAYVTDLSPANESTYRARFYFRHNRTNTSNGPHSVFVGLNAAGAAILRVQYRGGTVAGAAYEVRAAVLTTAGMVSTDWFAISDAPHAIEVNWASDTAATFGLYVDGVLMQMLTKLDTSPYRLESVRLGPSEGLWDRSAGTEYFDAFVSRRYAQIGP